MHLRAAAALIVAGVVASACSAQIPDRNDHLAELVGQPATLVVRIMGAPDYSFDAGGHRFLSYVDRSRDSFAGYDMFNGYGRYGRLGYRRLGFEAEPGLYERGCETTIEIADGRMAGYRLRGRACG